jgi:hypothetical protein
MIVLSSTAKRRTTAVVHGSRGSVLAANWVVSSTASDDLGRLEGRRDRPLQLTWSVRVQPAKIFSEEKFRMCLTRFRLTISLV